MRNEVENESAVAARTEVVRRFGVAWVAGDVDALMALMSPSATFRGSVGDRPGSVFRGSAEIRAAFTGLAGASAAGSSEATDIERSDSVDQLRPEGVQYHFGDRCLSFWSLPGVSGSGDPVRVEGADVFTFDDQNHIVCKDAYRKAFPPISRGHEREHN